jgi:hypothetical protein
VFLQNHPRIIADTIENTTESIQDTAVMESIATLTEATTIPLILRQKRKRNKSQSPVLSRALNYYINGVKSIRKGVLWQN